MEKPRESYLLFDTEPAAYQVKEGDDPRSESSIDRNL